MQRIRPIIVITILIILTILLGFLLIGQLLRKPPQAEQHVETTSLYKVSASSSISATSSSSYSSSEISQYNPAKDPDNGESSHAVFPVELKRFKEEPNPGISQDTSLYFKSDLSNIHKGSRSEIGKIIDTYTLSFDDRIHELDFSQMQLFNGMHARIYEFNTGISGIWAIELRDSNNQRFLDLSNINHYAFSKDKKLLAAYGKFSDTAGGTHWQTKIIDLQNRSVVILPYIRDCTGGDLQWSENKLISSSFVDESKGWEEGVSGVATMCAWENDGTLINSFVLHGAAVGGDTSPPTNPYGFLPVVPHGFYVMTRNLEDTVMDAINVGKCDFVVIDLDNPNRTITMTFDALVLKDTPTKRGMAHYHCGFNHSREKFEINLDSFTFEHPTFSFRNMMYEGYGKNRSLYRYSNWHTVQ